MIFVRLIQTTLIILCIKKKCVTINEVKFKYYDYFKGVRLCSNNKKKLNYYDLIKNSTITIDDCLKQKNMKVCGIFILS